MDITDISGKEWKDCELIWPYMVSLRSSPHEDSPYQWCLKKFGTGISTELFLSKWIAVSKFVGDEIYEDFFFTNQEDAALFRLFWSHHL
jgi:hypothetical protein